MKERDAWQIEITVSYKMDGVLFHNTITKEWELSCLNWKFQQTTEASRRIQNTMAQKSENPSK